MPQPWSNRVNKWFSNSRFVSNESWRGHWPCDWVKPAIHSFSNGGPLSLLLDCHCRLTSTTLHGYVVWCVELVVWEAVGQIKLMYVIGNQIVNIYTEWDEYWRDLCWLIWMNGWIYIYILCVWISMVWEDLIGGISIHVFHILTYGIHQSRLVEWQIVTPSDVDFHI